MTKLVFKVWRAASVLLPDGEVRHRQMVFVTTDGLELFGEPAAEPSWSSQVDFSATGEPRGGRLHVGVDIVTAAGLVVVTPTGGCMSCGSKLRGWYPEWATSVAAWPSQEVTSDA